MGTDSCNAGVVNLNWFALPNNDHPVIPQNLYRMSGGASNNDRFEQIGQSNVKHAFEALTQNLCGFGCNGVGGAQLGVRVLGSLHGQPERRPQPGLARLDQPFTGVYPRGDSPTRPTAMRGHTHVGPSHRILTEIADLNTSLNAGATYYAEAQYVTPHEYAWCQAHAGECNMYNNVSYRRYNVTGTASPFSFSAVGSTVRMQPAIRAWPGAHVVEVGPRPAATASAYIALQGDEPVARRVALRVRDLQPEPRSSHPVLQPPEADGVTVTNFAFHAPPQHPAWAADGTVGNTGYSSAPWTQSEAGGVVTWSSQTLAQNPNANAVRWGSLYNVRFDSNRPPAAVSATISFFKMRARMTVTVQGPSAP